MGILWGRVKRGKQSANSIGTLTFTYDRSKFKNGTKYMIDWLRKIDIEASDITDGNEYSNILVLNPNKEDKNDCYCITLLLCNEMILEEEGFLRIKEEAEALKSLPVIITLDTKLDNQKAILAKTLNIQIINSTQIEGLNSLIVNKNIPEINADSTLFIHKLAYYLRIKQL